MKYIKLILSLSIIFTSNAFSETFLCVGDEGAEVTNIGQSIQSKLITAERLKLILSNESGEWSLKYHGGIPTGLDRCINGSLCERSDDSFGGLFFKDNLNVFTFHTLRVDPKNQSNVTDILIKGLCTKL